MARQVVNNQEIKGLEIEGLKYFKEFCEENNITYFLAYGTLLGSIRHEGFIPWDDDIDLWIPRKDYEKLLLLKTKFDNENWELMSYKTNHGYGYPWAKICNKKTSVEPSRFHSGLLYGVSLDIFPLDSLPGIEENDPIKKCVKMKEIYTSEMRKIRPLVLVGKSTSEKFKEIIRRVYYHLIGKYRLPLEKAISTAEIELINLDVDNLGEFCISCSDAFDVGNHMFYNRVFRKSYFFNSLGEQGMASFEGDDYPVPIDTDAVLKVLYGDYMKLPPVEKRISQHFGTCYWKR